MENNIYGQERNLRRCPGFIHVIKKGDTLYKLGKKYNVKVSAIIFANPYVNVYNLQIGDEICIPRVRSVVPIPFYQGGEEDETNMDEVSNVEAETDVEDETSEEAP